MSDKRTAEYGIYVQTDGDVSQFLTQRGLIWMNESRVKLNPTGFTPPKPGQLVVMILWDNRYYEAAYQDYDI